MPLAFVGLPHANRAPTAPHRRARAYVEGMPTNDRAVGLRQANERALNPRSRGSDAGGRSFSRLRPPETRAL